MTTTEARNGRATTAILLAQGPLREGVAASLTSFVYRNSGHIVYHDQYVDREKQRYFARLEWSLPGLAVSREEIGQRFAPIAEPFGVQWRLHFSDDIRRVAIFVSKLPYCLYDILARYQSGEWKVEIPLIVSNHPELEPVAKQFGIAFHCFPITPANKRTQEQKELALLREHGIEFIVLARYMQILSGEFVAAYPDAIINIHHAFLPSFPGPQPYHAAYHRGVKIIGATSHYATEQLDAGPIIEQDVIRVSHLHTVEDLIRMGRDLEKVVLARAVWHHIQRKILVYDGRTVIFG